MKSYLVGYHYIGKREVDPLPPGMGRSTGNVVGVFRASSAEGAVDLAHDGRPVDPNYAYWATEVTEYAPVVTFEERDKS